MTTQNISPFAVISGATVHEILRTRQSEVIDLVERAYLLHGSGETTNPPSYFLRFPDKPSARIIALPAAVRGDVRVDGLKWISSFPDNLARGIPRASAVLLLNDAETGYPFACLEASIISAVRTAASAATAVRHLAHGRPASVGFLGTGLIARYLHEYLGALGLSCERVGIHDLSAEYADGFARHVTETAPASQVTIHQSAEDLIRSADLVVLATTAAQPHLVEPAWFAHNPLVLHISLRDLAPAVILSGTNVVDDIEHVLKAETSLHLTEQQIGGRDFIAATLYDAITGAFTAGADRPVFFSPFGLGVLDLVVGDFVYRHAAAEGRLVTVDEFFYDMERHRSPAPAGTARESRGQ